MPVDDLCKSNSASLSDLCFAKCRIRVPVTIKSDKQPYPRGFLTMDCATKGCFSVCLWQYMDKDIYVRVATFFIDSTDVNAIQGILDKLN